jgi:hypothetical protein
MWSLVKEAMTHILVANGSFSWLGFFPSVPSEVLKQIPSTTHDLWLEYF